MAEVSAEVMQQLAQAQTELAKSIEAGGPPVASEVAPLEAAESEIAAAGSGQAKYLLVDHYFTGTLRRLCPAADRAGNPRGQAGQGEREQVIPLPGRSPSRLTATCLKIATDDEPSSSHAGLRPSGRGGV